MYQYSLTSYLAIDVIKAKPKPVANIVSSYYMNEEKERECRWFNLIIHDAPQSTTDLPESCKTEDIECATDIFNVHLDAKLTVLRLGKKTDKNADKPRLMKVTVDTIESKAFILHNCTKLWCANQSNHCSKIYVHNSRFN